MSSVAYGAWQVVDGTETVTIYSRASADALLVTFTATAFRRALSRNNSGGGSALLAQARLKWHVWPATFSDNQTGYVLRPRDVIQDQAGARWTILNVETAEEGSRFAVETLQERTNNV